MNTMHWTVKTTFLSAAAFLVCATGARADTKVTFGVSHMCCGSCQVAAKAALTKVSSDVSIDETNVTVTLKAGETDLLPVLDALRKGGFPATKLDAGSATVTLGVAHLCCGKCKSALAKALQESNVEDLDKDAVAIGEGSVTVKAKAGKTLDLIPVLAAMEKGGFSASKITIATATAALKPGAKSVARRAAR